MKFKSFIFLSVVLLSFPTIPMAHIGGHGQINLNEVDVIPRASKHVATLIERGIEIKEIGKLDEKWKNVDPSQKVAKKWNVYYYVVSFTLPEDKETLYLLLSMSGALYDVNFTGNFDKWKL